MDGMDESITPSIASIAQFDRFDCLLASIDLMTADWAKETESAILAYVRQTYQETVAGMSSTLPLLQAPYASAPRFQPYLAHPSAKGRLALAKLRTGTHALACRLLKKVPREERTCRLWYRSERICSRRLDNTPDLYQVSPFLYSRPLLITPKRRLSTPW